MCGMQTCKKRGAEREGAASFFSFSSLVFIKFNKELVTRVELAHSPYEFCAIVGIGSKTLITHLKIVSVDHSLRADWQC